MGKDVSVFIQAPSRERTVLGGDGFHYLRSPIRTARLLTERKASSAQDLFTGVRGCQSETNRSSIMRLARMDYVQYCRYFV